MRRRQNNEIKVNHERWLVSYADFVTLLFAFFVVMYSVSQVNEGKYKILSEALGNAFQENITDLPNLASIESNTFQGKLANLSDVKSSLESNLGEYIKNGDVSISGDVSESGNEQWIEISLDANLLFSSGEASLQNSAVSTFSGVANILQDYDNSIEVSGHTDDIPINNNAFSNNWALSSARAVSVVNLLNSQGIEPERLSAVGYGEFRPIADNSTPEGRQENRRVVLRVADYAMHARANVNQSDPFENPENILGQDSEKKVFNPDRFELDSASLPNTNPQNQSDTPTVKPIELKGGGLLFTSDPDLPRPGLK